MYCNFCSSVVLSGISGSPPSSLKGKDKLGDFVTSLFSGCLSLHQHSPAVLTHPTFNTTCFLFNFWKRYLNNLKYLLYPLLQDMRCPHYAFVQHKYSLQDYNDVFLIFTKEERDFFRSLFLLV